MIKYTPPPKLIEDLATAITRKEKQNLRKVPPLVYRQRILDAEVALRLHYQLYGCTDRIEREYRIGKYSPTT